MHRSCTASRSSTKIDIQTPLSDVSSPAVPKVVADPAAAGLHWRQSRVADKVIGLALPEPALSAGGLRLRTWRDDEPRSYSRPVATN